MNHHHRWKRNSSKESMAWADDKSWVWKEKWSWRHVRKSIFSQKVLTGTQSISASWMKPGIINLKKLKFFKLHCIWPQSEKGQTTSKMPCERQLFITPRSLAHGADRRIFHLKLQNIRRQNPSSTSVRACYDALNKVITSPGLNFIRLGILNTRVVCFFFFFFKDSPRWFWCTASNTHLGLIIFQALL